MVKILHFFLLTVFLIIVEIYCSQLIGNILSEYYESDIVKSFKEEWVKYKNPFENAIMTNIKENYGAKSMNIYMKYVRDIFRITRGFYLSDNIVDVVFSDMILRDWPNLIMPEVSLSLPGNLVKVEATVGKMFVDTVYRMMRNESAVLYSEAEVDESKHSPFSLQQVHNTGKLTIIAEDCFLSGFSIVSFLGSSVTLGHSTFRLTDCKFRVEISSDVGTPPIMAPYFPKGPGKQIESLLSQPLREELVQSLQGAIYSYINTSVVFGKNLPKYTFNQQKLFKKTSSYLTGLCDKLNTLTLEAQKGSIELSDFEHEVETKTDQKQSTTYLSMKELKLYGLDTAYASRTGGSFEASQLSVADSIRFHSLQVRGKLSYDNGTQFTHNFAVELANVAVHVIINIEKDGSNSVQKFEVVLGRNFGFSVLPWETAVDSRLWSQAFVCGYIVNEVPARVTEHLSSVLTPAANDDENEDLKLSKENSQSGEVTKNVKIIPDDKTEETGRESKEKSGRESKEESSKESKESENDSKSDKTDAKSDSNKSTDSKSAESPENLSNITKDADAGIMVTSPDVLLNSDISSGEETIRGAEKESNNNKEILAGLHSDFENKNTDKQTLADGKSDAVLNSDFFSDDKGKKPFISDFENKQTDKQTLADGKSDAVLDSDFFSDDKGKKAFISDFENKQTDKQTLADGKSDAVLDSDFFSDDKGKKPFISDFENKQSDKETLADGKSDAVLDKKFFTDDDGHKKFISDGDGEKHPVESEEKVNNNKEQKTILIFASPENHGDKLNSEMTDNKNDKDQLNDEIAEQSDQKSVPIERNGKNSHLIASNNRKKSAKNIHKRNKKGLNNLKKTLRSNPRVNATKVQIRKITTRNVKHLHTSKLHNKTRLVQNNVHISDNEIR